VAGQVHTLTTGLLFGEQPRWHDGRLWFSDWGTMEVIALGLDGGSEVILEGPSFPLCIDCCRMGACWSSRRVRDFSCAGSPMARWLRTET
jgi:sugar lactone lactonase YvrE